VAGYKFPAHDTASDIEGISHQHVAQNVGLWCSVGFEVPAKLFTAAVCQLHTGFLEVL
jgi:hypothetical protein